MGGDIIPSADNTYNLGSTTRRWQNIYVGPGSIDMTDTVTNTLTTLTVTNGVLLINGANQLQVGQLKFVDNTIESTSPSIDIQIGYLTDTANWVVNRKTVHNGLFTLGSGSNITFGDTTTQSTAYTPTTVKGLFSVTTNSAGGGGSLSYSNGVFTYTPPLNIPGNAATVTNGVYTTGSYSDPSWLTISKSKVGLGNVENTALSTSTFYLGTTQITYNRASGAQTLAGVSIDGNAATATNGVVTTGSYSDPSWLTISKSKVGLGNVENTALSTSTHYIGTTSIQYNRASASQTLTGVSIDGNAATATNGVVTTGSYSDPSWLTISKSKVGLSAVENTALSTWPGTTNITTVGTLTSGSIGTGFTAIPNSALASSTISGVSLGGNLANLTAGYGISFSTGTTYNGSTAITINRYEGVTVTSATGAGNNGWTYSLNLGTASGLNFIDVGGNFTGTVTITGTPVVGRITRLVLTGGIKGATLVTVSGLTAANSSNGTNQFAATSGTASSVIVEFYSSTTALSGVYMNCSGAK